MKERKTAAAKRREALVRQKIEKRSAKHHTDQEDDYGSDWFLDKQLLALGIAGGYRYLPICDSTNNEMKKFAQSIVLRESQRENSIVKPPSFDDGFDEWLHQFLAPRKLPYVIVANEQTAGRGRQSNTWWTGQDALAFSMLLDAKQHGLNPRNVAYLSLGIGFATMQALRCTVEETLNESKNDHSDNTATMPKIEIRWPNDVYVNDRKISGILIEVPNMRHIVIGVGINTNNSATDAPEEIRDKIITLGDVLGRKIDQDRLIFYLCREIMDVLKYFPSHLSELLEKVEKNLYQVDKLVNISQENEQISGKCLGLNPDGSLRVLTETGEKAVISGVVI